MKLKNPNYRSHNQISHLAKMAKNNFQPNLVAGMKANFIPASKINVAPSVIAQNKEQTLPEVSGPTIL